MSGRTGKRRKPPGDCGRCKKPISGKEAFMRESKADFHETCWFDKQKEAKA